MGQKEAEKVEDTLQPGDERASERAGPLGGWGERPDRLHLPPQPPVILFPSPLIYDLNIKPGTKFIVLFLGNHT